MNIAAVLLVVILSAGAAWLAARHEKLRGWKTALLFLFFLAGGAVGNLVLGYIDRLTVKYVYFSILGVAGGCWLGYLLFRKLFE